MVLFSILTNTLHRPQRSSSVFFGQLYKPLAFVFVWRLSFTQRFKRIFQHQSWTTIFTLVHNQKVLKHSSPAILNTLLQHRPWILFLSSNIKRNSSSRLFRHVLHQLFRHCSPTFFSTVLQHHSAALYLIGNHHHQFTQAFVTSRRDKHSLRSGTLRSWTLFFEQSDQNSSAMISVRYLH